MVCSFLSTTAQLHATHTVEKVEGGERDTQLVHVNEATAVQPEATACHRPRKESGSL